MECRMPCCHFPLRKMATVFHITAASVAILWKREAIIPRTLFWGQMGRKRNEEEWKLDEKGWMLPILVIPYCHFTHSKMLQLFIGIGKNDCHPIQKCCHFTDNLILGEMRWKRMIIRWERKKKEIPWNTIWLKSLTMIKSYLDSPFLNFIEPLISNTSSLACIQLKPY